MRILAIETVGTQGTLALLDDQRVLAELELDRSMRSAQSLAPGIERLLVEAGWHTGDVELVAVAEGPGSFTGLRIGVTTAKVFAYATGCQVVGVSTMAAIASRVPGDIPRFSVALDAQRGELFVADFSRAGARLVEQGQTRIEDAQQWISRLSPATVVSGPGLARYEAQLVPHSVVESRLWAPTAGAVGQVGWLAFAGGHRSSPFELVPRYYRRTAAEEKAAGAGPAVSK